MICFVKFGADGFRSMGWGFGLCLSVLGSRVSLFEVYGSSFRLGDWGVWFTVKSLRCVVHSVAFGV